MENFNEKLAEAFAKAGINVKDDNGNIMSTQELANLFANSNTPEPDFLLNDPRLENAFKSPVADAEGYSERIPAIYTDYRYAVSDDGVKVLSLKSAMITSSLYSKYLDEEALVWDSIKQELFHYIPDEQCPEIAFKGSIWQYAMKLKEEYSYMNLCDIYKELVNGK